MQEYDCYNQVLQSKYNMSRAKTPNGPALKKFLNNKNLPYENPCQTERNTKRLWTTYYFDPINTEIKLHLKPEKKKHTIIEQMNMKQNQNENLRNETPKKMIKRKSSIKKPSYVVTDLNFDKTRELKISNDKIKERIICLRQKHYESHSNFKFYHPSFLSEIDAHIAENTNRKTPKIPSKSVNLTQNNLQLISDNSKPDIKPTKNVSNIQNHTRTQSQKNLAKQNNVIRKSLTNNFGIVFQPSTNNEKHIRNDSEDKTATIQSAGDPHNQLCNISRLSKDYEPSHKKTEKFQKKTPNKVMISEKRFSQNLISNFIQSEKIKFRQSAKEKKRQESLGQNNNEDNEKYFETRSQAVFKKPKKTNMVIQDESDLEEDFDDKSKITFFDKNQNLRPDKYSTVTNSSCQSPKTNIFINFGDTYNFCCDKNMVFEQNDSSTKNLMLNPEVVIQETLQSKFNGQTLLNPRATNKSTQNNKQTQENLTTLHKNYELGKSKTMIPSKKEDFFKKFKGMSDEEKTGLILLHKEKFQRIFKNKNTKKSQEKLCGFDLSNINFNETLNKTNSDFYACQSKYGFSSIGNDNKTMYPPFTNTNQLDQKDISPCDVNIKNVRSATNKSNVEQFPGNDIKFRMTDNKWNVKGKKNHFKVIKKKKYFKKDLVIEKPLVFQSQLSPWKHQASENSFDFS